MPTKRTPTRSTDAGEAVLVPSWFIRLVVGVLLGVCVSIVVWANGLNANAARNETRVDIMAGQLNRIEGKLDALILNKAHKQEP